MEQENQYIEKKHYIISMIFLVVLVVALFTSTFIILNNKIEDVSIEAEATVPAFNETTDTVKEIDIFMLKEFNGKLGVYKNGDFQYDIDIYVSTLPEADKKLLSQGIEASSEQELNEIVSTYY